MLQGSSTLETRYLAQELKFIVPAPTATKVLAWARARMAPDPHGAGDHGDEYRITSLYFDTQGLDVYHRRGSFKRCKFRIRHYDGTPHLFLERKLRTSTVVTKRRTTIPPEDLRVLESPAPDPAWEGGWFQRRLGVRRLRPTCQVSYQRNARVGMTDYGPMRLTCDRDLRVLQADGLAFLAGEGHNVVDGQRIVELKFRRYVPGLFKQLIEDFALEPLSVSKYRLSLEALVQAGSNLNLSAPVPAVSQADIVDA